VVVGAVIVVDTELTGGAAWVTTVVVLVTVCVCSCDELIWAVDGSDEIDVPELVPVDRLGVDELGLTFVFWLLEPAAGVGAGLLVSPVAGAGLFEPSVAGAAPEVVPGVPVVDGAGAAAVESVTAVVELVVGAAAELVVGAGAELVVGAAAEFVVGAVAGAALDGWPGVWAGVDGAALVDAVVVAEPVGAAAGAELVDAAGAASVAGAAEAASVAGAAEPVSEAGAALDAVTSLAIARSS
jgi:hypothetical protein